MIFFNFLLGMYVAFELHKLMQFNTFFNLRRISTDYSDKIYNRTNPVLICCMSFLFLLEYSQ